MDNYVIINRELLEYIIGHENVEEYTIPLSPEIKKAFDAGMARATASYKEFQQIHPDKQEYISNLKLDI